VEASPRAVKPRPAQSEPILAKKQAKLSVTPKSSQEDMVKPVQEGVVKPAQEGGAKSKSRRTKEQLPKEEVRPEETNEGAIYSTIHLSMGLV